MGAAADSVRKRTRQISRSVDGMRGSFGKLGTGVRQALGVAGIAGALLAVKMAVGAVITTGAELEQSLVGAGARFTQLVDGQERFITKGTEGFRKLEDAAREMGRSTEFTANQAAEALNFFAKAGFSAEQAVAILPATIDLATAAEMDLARAADIASDSLSIFGLKTDDIGKFQRNFITLSNQMAKTVNISNIVMEDLFETMKLGAGAVTSAGVPVADFMALVALVGDRALKGSRAGTSLARAFTKLADLGSQRKLRGRLGVDILDEKTGQLKSFGRIIDEMNAGFAKHFTRPGSELRRVAFLTDVFGIQGFRAINRALNAGGEAFREYRRRVLESEGAMALFARTIRATRKNQVKEMNSAIEGLTISFSKANDSQIGFIVSAITGMFRGAEIFFNRFPAVATSIGILLTGIPAIVGLGITFALAVAGWGAAVTFLATGTAAAVAAWVGIGVAVFGVGVAFGSLLGQLGPVDDLINAILTKLRFFKLFTALTGIETSAFADSGVESINRGASEEQLAEVRRRGREGNPMSKQEFELMVRLGEGLEGELSGGAGGAVTLDDSGGL